MKVRVLVNRDGFHGTIYYRFDMDFDVLPREHDRLEVECNGTAYNGKLIIAEVLGAVHRSKIDNEGNTTPKITLITELISNDKIRQ